MTQHPSPVPGVVRLPSADRDEFPLDVILVEQLDTDGSWRLAGVGIRDRARVSTWLDANPGGTFDYWWGKDTNGYSYAVFHYAAATLDAVTALAHLRSAELLAGASPIHLGHAGDTGQLAQVENVHGPLSPAVDEPPPQKGEVPEPPRWSHPIAVALVWRLAAELVRRHPHRLWVHAEGGGMYDRVTVVDTAADRKGKVLVVFNAAGSHASMGGDGAVVRWVDAIADAGDPTTWLRRLEERQGLPKPPTPLPASTPRSLAIRSVAAFLASQLGSRRPWLTRPLDEWEQVGWHRQLAHELGGGRSGPLEAVFVGQVQDTRPKFAVTGAGALVRSDGQRFNLASLHRPGDPATALLVATVGDLLP